MKKQEHERENLKGDDAGAEPDALSAGKDLTPIDEEPMEYLSPRQQANRKGEEVRSGTDGGERNNRQSH